MQGFRKLRAMSPGQRQSFLSGPETARQFTAEERDILGRLNRLLPDSEDPPPAPDAKSDL